MKKILLSVILLVQVYLCSGQQDPMYTMYMFDKMLINPAFTGSSNWFVATVKYRNQFSGLSGNPQTQTFNIHSPIQKKHIGLGLKVINDKIAIVNSLNATADLSYHLNFGGGKLSLGLEAGIYNRKINYTDLILSSPGDNAIPINTQSSLVPDASFGIYYQKKQMYIGVADYHLIKSKFKEESVLSSNSKLASHIYAIAGNVFMLNKYWSWEPSMLLKIQPSSSIQLDLNAMVYYQEKLGVGLQLRTGNAFAAVVKFNILENLRMAYSYDYTLSKLTHYNKGSHEILISYGIKLPPPPVQKETHPRYYF